MEKDTEEKIIQLETKLAYLEDFLNQLQSVAVENSTTIEKLREENKLMAQKIRDLSDQMEGDIPNRRPPHY
ncbi:SlyX family protein [Treponema sp.]|uniref:SlyX family protein n=1 Tax=Treponema sp. TaxID=166 RepID=UPI001D24EDD1|nr:SlyX family protein [Treponema sp.]MBS7242429.1 SlyX family protein [Treponema sp.]MCI6442792.1 SlyX family protein [Spirochaetia bacterium]MDY4133345.1 SlyX family protein [Treponema sp.]